MLSEDPGPVGPYCAARKAWLLKLSDIHTHPHPAYLQERLEKEKKLTSDLGRAATKLQDLLKTTQDQLAKERDTVRKLQEQLDKAVSALALQDQWGQQLGSCGQGEAPTARDRGS